MPTIPGLFKETGQNAFCFRHIFYSFSGTTAVEFLDGMSFVTDRVLGQD